MSIYLDHIQSNTSAKPSQNMSNVTTNRASICIFTVQPSLTTNNKTRRRKKKRILTLNSEVGLRDNVPVSAGHRASIFGSALADQQSVFLAISCDSILGAGLNLLILNTPCDVDVGDGQLTLKLGSFPLLHVGVLQRNNPLPLRKERGESAQSQELIHS